MMRNGMLLMLLAVCSSSLGCVALAIGGGATGVAYAVGAMQRTYPYPIDVVWAAASNALDELELRKGYEVKDQLKGKIQRHTATGDRIEIKLTSHGEFTNLNLRVNTFGNKAMSLAIIHKIEQFLPRKIDESAPIADPPRLEVPAEQHTDDPTGLSFPRTPRLLRSGPAIE